MINFKLFSSIHTKEKMKLIKIPFIRLFLLSFFLLFLSGQSAFSDWQVGNHVHLRGRVVDASGAGIPNVWVRATSGSNTLLDQADANGYYEIIVYTAVYGNGTTWTINVWDSSLNLPVLLGVAPVSAGPLPAGNRNDPPTPYTAPNSVATTLGVTVQLVTGSIIKGTNIHANLSGIPVTINSSPSSTVYTSSTGDYTAFLENGSYTATALKTGYTFSDNPASATVSGSATNFTNITVTVVPNVVITGDITTLPNVSGLGFTVAGTWGDGTSYTGTPALTGYSAGAAPRAYTLTIPGGDGGSYTITPAASGYVFTPLNRLETVTASGQDFAAAYGTFTVTGTIGVTGGPTTLAGVTVTATQGATTVATSATNSNGIYTITLPTYGGGNGTYTLTASKTGYNNATTTYANTVYQNQTWNTTLTPTTYTISGYLDSAGVGLTGTLMNGITVRVDSLTPLGWVPKRTTTTTTGPLGNGYYSLTVFVTGDYQIVPVRGVFANPAFLFFPDSAQFTNPTSSYRQDFSYNATMRNITGTVTRQAGGYLAGTQLTLTQTNGTYTSTAFSASNGTYRFYGLDGGTYTITARKTGYNFTPPTLPRPDSAVGTITISTALTGDLPNQNFVAVLQRYTLTGDVTFDVTALPGVAMTPAIVVDSSAGWTNPKNPTSGSLPNYGVTVNALSSYSLTPLLAGYVFSPTSRTFSDVLTNLTGGFTATSPFPPTLNQPSNSATDQLRRPEFRWTPPNPGAQVIEYTLQIATNNTFTTGLISRTPTHSGTQFVQQIFPFDADLSFNTTYYWRVQGRNGTGLYTDWSTVYSFTTGLDTVAIISPINNAKTTQSPTLNWNIITGASSYDVEVYTWISGSNPNGAPLTHSATTTYWEVTPNREYNVRYYWRVRARNSAGTGAWSDLKFGSPDPTFTPDPAIPILDSPLNLSVGNTIAPILKWRLPEGGNATQFRVQVSTDNTFSTGIVHDSTDNTAGTGGFWFDGTSWNSYSDTLLNFNTTYYWRVNSIGTYISDWSEVRSFTTTLQAPKPIQPLNDTLVSVSPTLLWETTVGATDYEVAIYYPNYSTTTVLRYYTSTSNQTSFTVPALEPGLSYYWTVTAKNGTVFSACSHVFYDGTHQIPNGTSNPTTSEYIRAQFTTTNVVPVLVTPLNHSIVVTPPWSANLVWQSIPGETKPNDKAIGTHYHYQVSEFSDFNKIFIEDTILSNGNDNVPAGDDNVGVPLSIDGYSKTYYWRVRAIINEGLLQGEEGYVEPTLSIKNNQTLGSRSKLNTVGGWSEIWTFTTSLPAPVLMSPLEDTVSITPVLRWEASLGATDYDVEVYVYDQLVFNQSNYIDSARVTGTSYTLPFALLYNKMYEWRVRAHRFDPVYPLMQNYSGWAMTKTINPTHTSGVDSAYFTTNPSVPVPYSPQFDSTSVPRNFTLRWYAPLDEQAYTYQVAMATDIDFTNPVCTSTFPLVGSYTVNALTTSISTCTLNWATTYYWKVRALGSVSGWGPWSFTTNFTTKLEAPEPKSPIQAKTQPYKIPTVSTLPTLNWYSTPGALDYEVIIYDATGATIKSSGTGWKLTAWTPSAPELLNNTQYFWKVKAHARDTNSHKDIYSDWSSDYWPTYPGNNVHATFYTSAAIPILISPTNGFIGAPALTEFTWKAAPGAVSYNLQYSTNQNFPLSVAKIPVTGVTYTVPSKLTKETEYFWRVQAVNSLGDTTEWSAIWSFWITGAQLTFRYDPTGQFVGGSPSITNDVLGTFKYDSTVVGNTRTQTIYIKNTGEEKLWASLNFNCTSGGFSTTVLTNTQIIIDPGVEKAVPINFTPTSPGNWSCTLEVIHNDAAMKNNPALITLTGIAVQTKARLVVAPVNFGTVVLLSGQQEKTIALRNNSDVAGDYLVINELKFHNSPETLFTYVDPFPIYIAPGATFNLRVRFNPIDRVTNYSNNLHLINSSLNPDVTSLLSASTRDGNLHIEPLSWNFGINPTNKEKAVKIMNYASKAITITAKVITGDPESYDLTNNQPTPILLSPGSPGGTDEFIMNFAPHTVGKKDAVIEITCDDTETSKYYISFTGINGTGPVISATPNPIDFGTVSIGSTKDTTISIENKGASDLIISKKQFIGDAKALFSFVTDGDAVTITGGAKRDIKIRLTSAGNVGAFSAQLEILSNDPTNPSYKINLSGTLNSRSISTNLDKIIFDTIVVGYYKDTTFTITNTGNLDLSVSGIAVDGNHATDFTLRDAPQFPVLLTPGSQQIIKLRFAPAAAGTRLGRLIIYNSSEFNKEKVIVMRGYGKVVHAGIAVTPNPLDFGSIPNLTTKTLDLVISNLSGFARLNISSLTFASLTNLPFSFPTITFPIVIEPNSSYTLKITFAPKTTTSSYTTFLTIKSDAVPDSSIIVQVLGKVSNPGMNIKLPPVLKFGKVVKDSVKTVTFEIQNSGAAFLQIDGMTLSGVDKAEFKVNNTFPIKIDPDEKVNISVTFSPKVIGLKDAKITISSNDIYNIGEIEITAEGILKTGQITGVKKNDEIPTNYALSQNYPNPFNPSTRIEYAVPENAFVTIKVYNSIGQEVSTLINQSMPAGNYVIDWHADNLPSGIYFYKMNTEKFSTFKKMLYLR